MKKIEIAPETYDAFARQVRILNAVTESQLLYDANGLKLAILCTAETCDILNEIYQTYKETNDE